MAITRILEIPTFVHIASWRDVIDRRKTVPVAFSYPLKKPYAKEFSKEGGWTLPDLLDAICQHYSTIYKEEADTATVSGSPVLPLANRQPTDGKYGIWGHDIGDLRIDALTRTKDGVWHVEVGS